MFKHRLSWGAKLLFSLTLAILLSLPQVSDLGRSLLKRLENRSIDYRFLIRGPDRYTLDTPILIIFIDDDSAMAYGYRSPTPRLLLADLIDQLDQKGAAVIGIDVLLDRSYDDVGEAFFGAPGADMAASQAILSSANAALSAALSRAGDRVVLVKNVFIPVDGAAPVLRSEILPAFADHARLGYSISKSEGDDYHRWTSIHPLPGGHDAFAAVIHRLYTGRAFTPPDALRLSPEEPWMLMDFPGPPSRLERMENNFKAFAASEVALLPEALIKDRIILIGSAIEDLGDVFLTPFSTQKNGYLTSFGVELQAVTLGMMLQNRFIFEPTPVQLFFFQAGFYTLAATLFLFLRPILALIMLPVCMLAWAASSTAAFVRYDLLIPIAYPVVGFGIAFVVCQAVVQLTEQRYSRFLRNAFQQYLPPQLLDKLVSSEGDVALGGERHELSVFFSDLANFTSISERLAPEKLIEFLHIYFEEMTRILFRQRGTLDKYIGDAIMAFFGAPEPQKTHALRACNTALLMQRRIDELNETSPPNWVEVHVRMGVNTADVFVGNMGSNTRFNYTVMGDGVNLASRLEGINKLFGTRTLISEMTLSHVRSDPANADRFFTREVGRFVVKGKKEPAAVYELMGFADDVSPAQTEIKYRYEATLAAFYDRDFDTARAGFDGLWSEHADKASQFMLLQLDDFQKTPPGPDWKGDIRLMTK